MEKRGVPTAAIITHVFLNTAQAMTRMMGVPDYRYIVAQHPLSSLTDEEVKQRAEELADEVESILTGAPVPAALKSRTRSRWLLPTRQTHLALRCIRPYGRVWWARSN